MAKESDRSKDSYLIQQILNLYSGPKWAWEVDWSQ